jgi:hypothetical protein
MSIRARPTASRDNLECTRIAGITKLLTSYPSSCFRVTRGILRLRRH